MIIEDINDIEIYVEKYFKDYSDKDLIISFNEFVEKVAEKVEQHLCDEDFEWGGTMPDLHVTIWGKMIDEYLRPDECCPYCSNGCNYCLMTSY